MKTCLSMLLAAGALLVQPAHAADEFKPTQKQARRMMCGAANGSFQSAGTPPGEYMARLLTAAAGADPDTAGAEEKKQKLAAYWKDPEVMGQPNKGFFCNGIQANGSLLWVALRSFQDAALDTMLRLGADINVIDPKNGRTLLDEITAMYDWEMMHDETQYTDPWKRKSEDYLLPRLRDQYDALRARGALHAVELSGGRPAVDRDAQVAACLKTRPEDAPKRFAADYPGGLASKMGALTPKEIPGVTTVSVRQAACLLRADRELYVLHAMRDDDGLPRAHKFLGAAASGDFNDQYQKGLADFVRRMNKDSYLVYCHSDSCFLSYNSALRLAKAGARKVYWMRDGIAGWTEAGYPVERADGFLIGERR